MGCFNKIGFHSKLPIRCGDEIVYFICISDGRTDDITPCYFNDFIEPIYLPIFGTYNDYGSIENIVRDNAVEALEKALGSTIEEVIETIEEHSFKALTKKDDGCELYNNILTKIYKHIPFYRKYKTKEYKNKYGLCVTMEHKSVYDTMCNLYKHLEKPQEYKFLQIKFPIFLDKAIELLNCKDTIYTDEYIKRVKKELPHYAKDIISSIEDEKNSKNIFEIDFINGEMNKFANETIFHQFHHNMMLVNIVDLDYQLLRDTIYNFTYFNIALERLNGRYDVSSYGNQSVVENYNEFKKLHQCYDEIIEKLKY